MKKMFPLLAFFAMLSFFSCNDDDKNPSISFEKSSYNLQSGSVEVKIIVNNYDGVSTTIPIEFAGSAVKGEDYNVDKESISLGEFGGSYSIVINALNNYDADKTIELSLKNLPAGYEVKTASTVINLQAKDKLLYSFKTKSVALTESCEVEFTLLKSDGSNFLADSEIIIPVKVDETKSTAVEGVNFSFADDKNIVIAVGKNSGKLKLNCIAVAEGKNDIVLIPDFENSKPYVAGQYPTQKVIIYGSIFNNVLGEWKIKEVITTAESLFDTWWNDCKGVPVFNANDKLTFSAEALITSLESGLKNFFNASSEIEPWKEYNLRAGYLDTRKMLLVEVKNANRYFSASTISEDKSAYIGVRIIKDEETGKDLLDLYLLDYEPKDFMMFLYDFYIIGDTKPKTTSSGAFLNYHFEKAE